MAREIARLAMGGPQLAVRSVTPEDVLAAFLEGRNARTLRAYDGDIRDFARFLDMAAPQMAVVALISAGHGAANRIALAYRAELQARGLAAATIARRLAALRSVVRLARQLGQVAWELEVEAPKVQPYRDTRGPGDDGWKAMRVRAKARADAGELAGVRDRAILRVTHDLALRASEVCGLDLADVEIEAGVPAGVWILGKGRTARERLTLAAPTAEALGAWIRSRGEHEGPLFSRLDRAAAKARDGDRGRLTDRSVRRMVLREGEAAGVGRRVRPHGLRHHAVTAALDRSGGNVREVQKFSRHADPRTLLIYDDRRKDAAGQISRLVADED